MARGSGLGAARALLMLVFWSGLTQDVGAFSAFLPGLIIGRSCHSTGASLASRVAGQGNSAVGSVRLRAGQAFGGLMMGLNEDLWEAAETGNDGKVEQLLEKGAEVNSASDEPGKKSALHLAATQGHALVVDRLLAAGADPNLPSEFGSTALHFASAYGHVIVINYLLQYGADINQSNADEQTALDIAKFKGKFGDRVDFVEVVRLLEEAKAKANTK
mmetsp:Transcript_20794/g.32575  ORF Transcript_20794/g.32575 Transcript_20794/m.32575 type:complete len:217 (+) Transcript_20794:169-819(+)|eukprot:CAMPEP_0184293534 /NCGR_PEP_ID=MMETSP1049-20130417/4938_1 /TAXON_ID=77928 /ORGANISM="Proteomonas sulcata, Strain CCMP704" /LENGTH=216 /DNA_ID=CAMNT_0026601529 /DNA_START=60 /DNA_END=710 /DNA_ORIENTATION=-